MNIYYLMNKEQILLSFYIKEEYGEKTAYQDECFVPSSLLPVGFQIFRAGLNAEILQSIKNICKNG